MSATADPAELLLTDELLEEAGQSLTDTAGAAPATAQDMRDLLRFDRGLIFDAAQWSIAGDSAVRDKLVDVAVRFLGVADRWPTFGDNADVEALQVKVIAAARARDWHVFEDSGAWPGL